jgi:hypothetical protein
MAVIFHTVKTLGELVGRLDQLIQWDALVWRKRLGGGFSQIPNKRRFFDGV